MSGQDVSQGGAHLRDAIGSQVTQVGRDQVQVGSVILGTDGRLPAGGLAGLLASRRVWNIPAPVRSFTGRSEQLTELHAQLTGQGSAALVPAAALYGMGGVGKTQLALAYAARYRADFQVGWSIPAETPLTITTGMADLAIELGLPAELAPPRLATLGAGILADQSGWLLIFDNATDPADLDPFIPAAGGGQVLVTSRNPAWAGVADPVPVDVLPLGEAAQLLTRRSGDPDHDAAVALAGALGRLPLALEQAAGYASQASMPLTEYLEQFDQRRAELLAKGRPLAYRGTVAAAFTLTSQQLSERNPAAVQLLELCALLAPDELPVELLLSRPELLPEPLATAARDPLQRREVVAVLFVAGVLTRDAGQTARVHRLIQAVVWHSLDHDDQQRWARSALRLLAAAFPPRSDDVDNWSDCKRLLPHALAAINHGVELDVDPERVVELLDRVALYLWATADLNGARSLLEQARQLIERRLGTRHRSAAMNLSTYGKVLRELGQLAKAKTVHQQALAIREARLGPDHEEVAWSLGNLGRVLRQLGELSEAEHAHRRALSILEARHGPEDPDVAWALSNLGRTLHDLRRPTEARAVHQRALEIRQRRRDHPDVAWSHRNLARVLEDLGDLPGAHVHLGPALRIFQDRFGPGHTEMEQTREDVERVTIKLDRLSDSSESGFQSLFDGVSRDPWRMAGPPNILPVDGTLETHGGMGLLWYPERQFKDFVLRLEWMVHTPADNSGVFVRFPDPGDDPWVAVHQGYEVQIHDEGRDDQHTGAIYRLAKPTPYTPRPIGQWNSMEIQAIGQRYVVILNGEQVNDFVGAGDRDTEGFIGLQNHDDHSRVRFRHIRIKPLE